VANGKLSRAHVGLALASALVVLLASGVAISRISDQTGESPGATGPSSTSSSMPGLGNQGSATGSGPAGGAAVGSAAGPVAQATGGAASEVAAATTGAVSRTARTVPGAAGRDNASAGGSSPPAAAGSDSGSTASGGAADSGGGSGGGGQGSPPAPNRTPAEPLASASVSAGQGAGGAVVGLGLGNDTLADPDVTVGTNPVVGDHPPSEGTGVTLGGRFLHPTSEGTGNSSGGRFLQPPPAPPVLPG
jgi:hypothetical protein